MARDPQIELRVSRLENDTVSIYHLITEIRSTQEEHSQRFDGMDARFDGMDARFDGMDARFDGMDARSDRMDARFDGMDARFDAVETTLTEIVRRLPDRS